MKINTGEIVFDCIYDKISNASSDFQDYIRSAEIDGKYGLINIEKGIHLTSFNYNCECAAFEAFRKVQLDRLNPFDKKIIETQNRIRERHKTIQHYKHRVSNPGTTDLTTQLENLRNLIDALNNKIKK